MLVYLETINSNTVKAYARILTLVSLGVEIEHFAGDNLLREITTEIAPGNLAATIVVLAKAVRQITDVLAKECLALYPADYVHKEPCEKGCACACAVIAAMFRELLGNSPRVYINAKRDGRMNYNATYITCPGSHTAICDNAYRQLRARLSNQVWADLGQRLCGSLSQRSYFGQRLAQPVAVDLTYRYPMVRHEALGLTRDTELNENELQQFNRVVCILEENMPQLPNRDIVRMAMLSWLNTHRGSIRCLGE